jgi:hypothetical protein
MSGPRLPHRRLAAFALVAALAIPGGLVSVAADTTHQGCERERHACATLIISACCCDVGPADQSAPVTPPSGRTTLTTPNAVPLVLPAFWAVPPNADTLSLAALRLHSPPHPFDSSDLTILLSTLLI